MIPGLRNLSQHVDDSELMCVSRIGNHSESDFAEALKLGIVNVVVSKSLGCIVGLMSSVGQHGHEFSEVEWPFPDLENAVAISTVQVFREGFPILWVSHDCDGDWQVLCGTTSETKDAIVVCLGCCYQRDRTIGELADLPLGWTAWRDFVGGPWEREEKPAIKDDS